MKRSTILGLFVCLLSLTMGAQITQKPAASLGDLLERYENLGKKSGAVSDFFSPEEQRMLQAYFNGKKPIRPAKIMNNAGAQQPTAVRSLGENNPVFYNGRSISRPVEQIKGLSPQIYGQEFNANASPLSDPNMENLREKFAANNEMKPLFLAPSELTPAMKAEILAAEQQEGNVQNRNNNVTYNVNSLAAIIPNAGATETFAVVPGDFFYDPTDGTNGGPGGDCTTTSSGDPGDYPNCGCTTVTTLTGTDLSVEFLSFKVFGNFDFLNIYDGPDTSSPQIYDSNLNGDTDTLAGMIAANGSGVFTSTSGALTFEFNATAVVNSCGWEVEVLGGGGPPPPAESTVYALNLRASCGTDFGTFPVGGPYNIDPISSITSSIFAGDFDNNDVLYALDNTAQTLLTIDTATGVETTVGPLTNLDASHTVSGLAWNEANGTMYASSTGGGSTTIYTVDLATGALAPIGNTGNASGIWLAIDNSGNAYMADISDDNLYSVDLSTGGSTLIGALGIDISFAQDADFDPDTGILYMAAYIGGGVNQLCSIDFTTGTVTQLGSINSDCAEVGLLAILGTGGGGGGSNPCATTGPSNSFENGKSFTKNLGRIVAHDITVADGEDMLLESITIPAFIGTVGSGVNADNVDIYIYEDNGSGAPGTLISSEIALVPTSQTVIGNNFGFDIWSVEMDIADVTLSGQIGSTTTYWIGLSLEPTDGSNTFWENSTAGLIGFGEAYDDGIVGFVIDNTLEGVYTFEGTCSPIGGGGGDLTTVYGINNGNFELIGFPVDDPATTEVFGDSPVTVNFENAGAIDPANPTTGYVLDNGGQFYSFDVTTGFYTLLGNIPGDWVGMEFDRTTGTLYAIAGADLFIIDPMAVTATLVGATGINPGDLPIALAIDGAGVGYTYELVNQMFYSIDLATATATAIGDIGFDANFGQGMCYDPTTDMVYMAAFNNSTFAAEWRSVDLATGATTLIGPIVTTAATTQVAWASVGETLPPPACPEPTNLVVSNVTATTADLSWDAEPNASNGYIWYVFEQGANPITDTPVATGTTAAGTTTATATGLTGGISYDFYVVADCDSDGLSQYAGPITFATQPSCGGKFYDTGGPTGDYQNDENVTTTIMPENTTDFVTVTFTAFDVEATWDALYVYDGPDASAPLISSGNPPTNSGFPAGGFYGTDIIGPFASSHPSGALTFVFMSDSSVPRAGWEADVTCALTPPPNDMIVNSIDVDEIGVPYTDPAVHMPAATTEDGNPQGCDLTGASGVWYNFVAAADGTANAMIVTPGGASSVTFYTAPDEDAVETDLVLVPQQTNQCVPGTTASINTVGGQAYYVFVLNTGAITDIVIDGTNIVLGVGENTIEGFSYYPNPTTGVLNLKSVDNIEQVSLYNLLGQRVLDNSVNATASQVDISSLSAGTYLMKVTVNGQIGTYRVLKN